MDESKRHISARRLAILLFSIFLIAAGLLTANTFSGPVEAKQTIAKGTVSLAANGQQCITYQVSQSGEYYFDVNAKTGSVMVYSGNSTVDYRSDGTVCPKAPEFNSTNGRFISGLIGGYNQPATRCIVFLNPDGVGKDVSYEISRNWTYTNYIYLTAGIAAAAAGFLLFGLALLQDKLRAFNMALENQL